MARFAYYLLELAEAQGKSLKAPILVSVPVPLSELANSLGFSPESLSRAITRFEALGAIRRLGKNRFQIMDLAALRAATLSSSVLL